MSTTEVRARASGYLEKVNVFQGMEVKDGDVLFAIDPRVYNAELAKAEAALSQVSSRLKRADSAVDRAGALHDKKSISQEEFEKTVGQRADAEADLRIAETSFDLARWNRFFTNVKAPTSGVVEMRPIHVGSLVKADTTLLATICDARPDGRFLRR